MKFLTFVDLHLDKKGLKELVERAKKSDINFVICAGDVSWFGQGWKDFLKAMNDIGKKVYLIPGNHEEKPGMMDELKGFNNCINLHANAVEQGDYIFLGYGGGGFNQEDIHFRKIARKWYGHYNGRKIVLVTHGPPFATRLDLLPMGHVGNKDYRMFIDRIKPKLVICGHLHETAGKEDSIGKIKLINPGWEGMVIELK
ncbi:metallophosphoesterase [Candidatus Woesearchaeota archaeon]|nr:metallophosphoesterase [Candidatus Woesearchaeota archaeon]